jgi:UrcA family protein
MSRSIKAFIVGLTIFCIAQTASAATHFRANNTFVRYGDLNLQNEADAAKLLKRLSNAADDVCHTPPPGDAMLRQRSGRETCREDALQNAVAAVDHPVLTALYQSTRSNSMAKLASR